MQFDVLTHVQTLYSEKCPRRLRSAKVTVTACAANVTATPSRTVTKTRGSPESSATVTTSTVNSRTEKCVQVSVQALHAKRFHEEGSHEE